MTDFQKYLDENLKNINVKDIDKGDNFVESYDIYEEIRNSIISLRNESHLTQKELAKRTGITQANLSNIEKGISKPTIESLKRIADATGKKLSIEFYDQEVQQ